MVQKVVVACDTINPIFHGDMVIEEWPPVTILEAMNNLAHCAKVQVSACNLLRDLAEPVLLEDKEEDKVEARLLLCIVSGEEYAQATLQALQNYSDNEIIQSTALCYLQEIMVIERSTTSHIIQGGAVEELVTQASQTNSWQRIAIAILERDYSTAVLVLGEGQPFREM